MDKVKWFFAALAAFGLGLLAFVYGKKTPAVLRAKVRAHNARGRVLNTDIKTAEMKASAEASEEQKQLHLDRANTLKIDRAELEKARKKLLNETGDLEAVSDADLAAAHNKRSGSATG